MDRTSRLILGGCVAVALSAPRPARACSGLPTSPLHELDPLAMQEDATAPSPPTTVQLAVRRAPGGCDSCGTQAYLEVSVAGATDDRTPPARLGYLLRLESGVLPEGLILPVAPLRALDGTVVLEWHDEGGAAAFGLSVAAVDLAGLEGAAALSDTIDSDAAGCAVVRGRRSLAPVIAGLLFLWFCLRRR